MKSYYQKNILVWILCLGTLCMIFFAFPSLDIYISQIFYVQDKGFVYNDNYLVRVIFELVPLLTHTAAIIYLTIGLYQYFIRKKFRKTLLYLLLALIIGPGVIVNLLLKDNFGRARPRSITEFGGDAKFSRMLLISDQCNLNCSFSSGHAAGAYHFTSFSFILPRRYFNASFNIAMLFGTIVGLIRVMQGGHFASDVLFSCLVVLLVNYALRWLIFKFPDSNKITQS